MIFCKPEAGSDILGYLENEENILVVDTPINGFFQLADGRGFILDRSRSSTLQNSRAALLVDFAERQIN